MRQKRRAALAAVVYLSLALGTVPAMAAGPIADPIGTGYDDQTWARLTDGVLEYDEVPERVHAFNSSIKETWDNLEKVKRDLTTGVDELLSAKRKAETLKDSAKNEGDIQTLINAATQVAILDAVVSGMTSSAVNPLSKANMRAIEKGEDQITMIVQGLMINYDSLQKQSETMDLMQQMYDRQYQILVNKQALGMATQTQVLQAQKNQLSAQSNVHLMRQYMSQLLPTISNLTGWPADEPPTIARIPAVDPGVIAQMNLEEDTRKAIGNNTALQNLRRSAAGKTNDGVTARLEQIKAEEQKMAIFMQSLYQDVSAKQAAYEAAKAGYLSAQKSAESSRRMYEMGMMAEADYLGTQLSFCSKEAAYQSADTGLRLAIETYQWAVRGLVDPS